LANSLATLGFSAIYKDFDMNLPFIYDSRLLINKLTHIKFSSFEPVFKAFRFLITFKQIK